MAKERPFMAEAACADPQPPLLKTIKAKISHIFALIDPNIRSSCSVTRIHMKGIIQIIGESLHYIKTHISLLKENKILVSGTAKLLTIDGVDIKNFQHLTHLEDGIESLLRHIKIFLDGFDRKHLDTEIPDISSIGHPIFEAQRKCLIEIELEVIKSIISAMHEIRDVTQEAEAHAPDAAELLSDLAFISNLFAEIAECERQRIAPDQHLERMVYGAELPNPGDTEELLSELDLLDAVGNDKSI